MCGRYAAGKSTDELVEELRIEEDRTGEPVRSLLKSPQQPPAGAPDWNLAPTKNARVVVARPTRQLRLMTWGLVPSWAKATSVGVRMINARAETVLSSRSFARAAATRRALVPADGWYEWRVGHGAGAGAGTGKQPFFLSRVDGGSVVMAGLYEFWREKEPAGAPSGGSSGGAEQTDWLTTFTIITTVAEPALELIHDRQPLVLDPDQWDAWLDPSLTDPHAIEPLLATNRPGRFEARPVGAAVGDSRANGPELLRPAGQGDSGTALPC